MCFWDVPMDLDRGRTGVYGQRKRFDKTDSPNKTFLFHTLILRKKLS